MPGRKSKFTSDRPWRAFRLAYLADPENALCRDCAAEDIVTEATVVHHLKKRADDPSGEFWFDPAKCTPLCVPCHNRRTARGE